MPGNTPVYLRSSPTRQQRTVRTLPVRRLIESIPTSRARPEARYKGKRGRPDLRRGCALVLSESTNLVHNGVKRIATKNVRQSVGLPSKVAAQVRRLARTRRLSANRMLVELIENGIDAEKRRQLEFFNLAERFRAASDPEEVRRLGDQIGRMVFGD